MLIETKSPFQSLSYLTEWLFGKSEQKLELESSYFIIAECIGRLAFLDPTIARKIISNASTAQQNRRLVIASSLRFAIESQAGELNE